MSEQDYLDELNQEVTYCGCHFSQTCDVECDNVRKACDEVAALRKQTALDRQSREASQAEFARLNRELNERAIYERERVAIERALDNAGLYDVEPSLATRIERVCDEAQRHRRRNDGAQFVLDKYEDDASVLLALPRPNILERIEKLGSDRDRLLAIVKQYEASK